MDSIEIWTIFVSRLNQKKIYYVYEIYILPWNDFVLLFSTGIP